MTPEGTDLSVHHLPEMEENYYQNLIALSDADMFGYTWIKAFRKKVSDKIYFDAGVNLFEDEIFTCKLLEKPVSIYYLKEPIYYYVRTNDTLAQKTHQDYCQLCDKVFYSWKKLLKTVGSGEDYLEKKANHMAKVCKYYGLERKVNPWVFYHEMASCNFMQYISSNDSFIYAIKSKKWIKVAIFYLKYNLKVLIAKHIARKADK